MIAQRGALMAWLHDRVVKSVGKHADLYFPRRGALNWIRSLALMVENSDELKADKLKARFLHVQRRQPVDEDSDTRALAHLFSSAQYLDSIQVMSTSPDHHDRLVRIAVVGWYYGCYWASNAMITAKTGTHPETHMSSAKTFSLKSPVILGVLTCPSRSTLAFLH